MILEILKSEKYVTTVTVISKPTRHTHATQAGGEVKWGKMCIPVQLQDARGGEQHEFDSVPRENEKSLGGPADDVL